MAPGSVLETVRSVLQRNMVREFLAEFLSTYVMMVSGWVALGGWGGATDAVLYLLPTVDPRVISFLPLPLRWELGKKRGLPHQVFLG